MSTEPHLPSSNRSYWVDSSPAPEHPSLASDATADVVVVGGGIFGLTTALLLQEGGLDVVLLEAARVCTGVSGYTTGKLSSQHQLKYASLRDRYDEETARRYAAANEAAIDQVEAFATRHGIDCAFERRPAFVFARDDDELEQLEAEVEAASGSGLDASFVTETELPFEVRGALRIERQALFHVRRYCLGLARAFLEAGGRIHERTRVVDVEDGDEEVVAITRAGRRVRARHLVLATLVPFLDRGGYFARLTPMRSYIVAARVPAPALRDMHISAGDPIRSLRPAAGGQLVLIGGESHLVGQEPDTWERYRALEAFAREHFGAEEITHRWSSQDFVSVDGLPFVGRMPLTDRVLVGTGYAKWGLTLGTAAAMDLAAQVRGQEAPWGDLFDARRVGPGTAMGATERGLDYTKRMVGDRARALRAPEAESLEPGQGAIATHGGERVAAYRSATGELRVLSPVCTHMGCYVTWNPAETSWDCPCHGSRFGTDGRVLQGPAVRDLERR